MEEVVAQLSSPSAQCDQSESKSAYYPPRLTYSVEAVRFPPVEQLDCTIQVRGAISAGGKVPYFRVHSTCSHRMKGELMCR